MATVPSEVTAVAGSILTAAMWNSNVRDAVNFVISPPLFVAHQTVSQSIASGGWAAIAWDTEDLDRDNGHSTTTNTTRYTVQTPGWYEIVGKVSVNNIAAAGWVAPAIVVNTSGNRYSKSTHPTNVGFTANITTVGTLYLNVNDYAEIFLGNGTNTAATTNVGGTEDQPRVSIRWCST